MLLTLSENLELIVPYSCAEAIIGLIILIIPGKVIHIFSFVP